MVKFGRKSRSSSREDDGKLKDEETGDSAALPSTGDIKDMMAEAGKPTERRDGLKIDGPTKDKDGNLVYINPVTGQKVVRLANKNDERVKNMVAAAAEKHIKDPEARERAKKCGVVLAVLVKIVLFLAPIYAVVIKFLFLLYKILPKKILSMLFGLALCFTGGMYYASIAAIEAFRQLGWQTTKQNLLIVYDDLITVKEASELDDLVDDDKDGIADVDQIDQSALMKRKMSLALIAVKDPGTLNNAAGGLWIAWLSVLATLKLEFARTTSIALGIVEMLKLPLIRLLVPMFVLIVQEKYHHWIETSIVASITILGVLLAMWLQAIISAFYSGLRGGLIFSQNAMMFAADRGWLSDKYKDAQDLENTKIDEYIGYILAACGFIYQLNSGFCLPFPFNLIMLPLTIVEYYIRWQIMFG